MAQYIDKDALVAEIERKRRYHLDLTEYNSGYKNALIDILSFLNTLEVKGLQEEPVSIDFEQELYKAFGQVKDFTLGMQIAKWFYDMGKNSQEPVSDDLEEAATTFADVHVYATRKICFKAGAKWQKEQFEKNRLKHCNSIANEQAELEQGFIDQHLDKHQRMPTFLDAIEYGIRLQKEQIEEALLSEVLPCFMHGGEADEVVAKLDEVLNQKKKED